MKGRNYSKSSKISSFVGVFPINKPRFAILVIVDEPKGNKQTLNYATGGWVAAPAVGRIVNKIAPIVGIPPNLNANYQTPKIERKGAEKFKRRKPDVLIKKAAWSVR